MAGGTGKRSAETVTFELALSARVGQGKVSKACKEVDMGVQVGRVDGKECPKRAERYTGPV